MSNTVDFWRGDFGDEYTKRNVNLVDNNVRFFKGCVGGLHINSIVEFGAGSGQNIRALKVLYPNAHITAYEINGTALEELRKIPNISVHDAPICEARAKRHDLALTKGLLIHVPPEDLPFAYKALYSASSRYILMCEYYNPTPVEISYRGETGRLWKRDFCGEMMDTYPDLRLIEYGFAYRRAKFPQDDITFFLMEKSQ